MACGKRNGERTQTLSTAHTHARTYVHHSQPAVDAFAGWKRPGEHSSQRTSAILLPSVNEKPASQLLTVQLWQTLAPRMPENRPGSHVVHVLEEVSLPGW